jgi:vanillate O-demethylase monooxygenase subunit
MIADQEITAADMPRECTFTPADWQILSRFWHPVAFSHDVGSAPVPARLLDQDLVVYRTSGAVVVARDICLHRGARLTLGQLDGDELVCAYHGWRYGTDGRCTRIPSQPREIRISPKARLFTYPAAERYGLVWTCLAGSENPDLPDWPEAEDPGYRWLALPPLDWAASSAREVDNFLDVSHFSFVHAVTFGNAAEPEIPEVKVERTPRGLRYDFSFLANNPDASPVSGQTSLRWDTSYHLTLPFSVRIWQQYPERGESFHVVFNASCPVSARRSRTFFFVCRNFDFDVPAEEILDWEGKIMAEDQRIVESQRPEELPLNLHDELHVRADRMTTAYRKALTELGLGASLTS